MIKGNRRLLLIKPEDGITPENFWEMLGEYEKNGWKFCTPITNKDEFIIPMKKTL